MDIFRKGLKGEKGGEIWYHPQLHSPVYTRLVLASTVFNRCSIFFPCSAVVIGSCGGVLVCSGARDTFAF